jgi:hypothetical protein
MNKTINATAFNKKPIILPNIPDPNIPPNIKPASPPIIMPFMKLPPLKNPRFVVEPEVDDDLFDVELLLIPLSDLAGVWLNDFLPELKERGLASALPAGTVTTTVKANRLNSNKAFFHI